MTKLTGLLYKPKEEEKKGNIQVSAAKGAAKKPDADDSVDDAEQPTAKKAKTGKSEEVRSDKKSKKGKPNEDDVHHAGYFLCIFFSE